MPKVKLGELFLPTPIDSDFMWDIHNHLWNEYSKVNQSIKITPSTSGIRFTVWEEATDATD